MKKRNGMKWFLSFVTGMVLCVLPSSTVKAADVYTVTIRPGSVARFSDSFIQKYQSMYGAEVTEKVGSIKVKIPVGGTIPMLPNNSDLVYKEDAKGRYTMNTSWYPEKNVVDGNESFVVKYDALVNEAAYKVRYVDSESGKDILAPVITQGNIGETYTYYSEKIENYTCKADKQSITLSENTDKNVLIFAYTSTKSPAIKEVVTEENSVQPQSNVTERENSTHTADREPGNTQAESTASGNTASGSTETENVQPQEAQTQESQTETEPEEIKDKEAGQADIQEETIEEDKVPLANKTLENEKDSKATVVVMIFAVAAAGICFYVKFRKRQLK